MSSIFGLKGVLGGVSVLAFLAPAAAFAGDRAGVLNCKLMGSGVSVLVENQMIDCLFQDNDEGMKPVRYTGKLTKVGANISVNGPGELGWGVVAATNKVGPGALAGEYVGPGATVKLGVGGGGALLVGGSNNTFSLQPLNVQAGTGLGVTAGVESLTLEYVPEPPPPPVKRHRHRHHHH
jgi:hypothetical protein